MKFYCDACNTKYAISDEKVRGKVLKVRCKSCGNIITVREAQAPVPQQTDPTISEPMQFSADDASVPAQNWYYALNGQTFGPFSLEGLRRKYSTAEIGDATYVWHQQMGPWTPVARCSAFADALAMGHKIVPARKTLGFTGPVEAVRAVHGGVNTAREGAVPNASHAGKGGLPAPRLRTEPPPGSRRPSLPHRKKPPATPAPPPEARPLNDVRKDKLSRLRNRLDSSLGAEPGVTREEPRPDDPESLPKPVGGEALLTFASGIVPAASDSAIEKLDGVPSADMSAEDVAVGPQRGADAVPFEMPPRPNKPQPSPSSRSDILDFAAGPDEPPMMEVSEADDSGVIPFFPEATSLGALASEASIGSLGTSQSLLVDVGALQAARRKKSLAAAAMGGTVLFGVLGIGAVMSVVNAEKEPAPAAVVATVGDDSTDDGKRGSRTYSPEELGKFASTTMNLGEEMLFTEDEVGEDEEEPVDALQPDATTSKAPKIAAALKGTRAKSGSKSKKVEKPQPEPEAAPPEEVDPLKAVLMPRANRTPTVIRAPEDKLAAKAMPQSLTKEQARAGFQRVKKSIRICRERHNRRSAKLAAGKLKIWLTVAPTGKVTKFDLQPRSVQNTAFHSCMTSKRETWRFAPFSGDPVMINTSVIIQ